MAWATAIMAGFEVAKTVAPGVTQLLLAVRRPSGGVEIVGQLDVTEDRVKAEIEHDKDAIARLKADIEEKENG